MAISAASLHAVYAPELSRMETGKPWSVSVSLRGFYDDNWRTAPDSDPRSKDSWGFEARPHIALNLPFEQTFLGASYLNSSRYFEARPNDEWDFTHQFRLRLDHQFTPRYRLEVRDAFVYGQEPEVGIVALPLRADKSFIHNAADITFFGDITRQLGFAVGYENDFWDYLNDSTDPQPNYSTALDRVEHYIPVDLRWQARPDLVALVGYRFGIVDYTGDGALGGGFVSEDRNRTSHTMYLGVDYDITPQLRTSLRGGAQLTDYDLAFHGTDWSPYVDASLSYIYAVGSHADLGFRHQISATDLIAVAGTPTLDQEVSAVYLSVNHQITPKLSGNLLAQYQIGSFNGGGFDDQEEKFLILGLYLAYQLNQYLALEAGYNFDWLDSDAGGRDYDRNRVYLGVRASY